MKPAILSPELFEAKQDGSTTELSVQELLRCSSQDARDLVPAEWARRVGALPLGVINDPCGERLITVATSRELTPDEERELRFISGCVPVIEIVHPCGLKTALELAYAPIPEEILLPESRVELIPSVEDSSSPVPQLLKTLVLKALSLNAPDLHLVSTEHAAEVLFRLDGLLIADTGLKLTHETLNSLSRRVQVLAKLPTGDPSAPIEGSFSVSSGELTVRVRASIIQTIFGARIVLRILETNPVVKECPDRFQALGMNSVQASYMHFSLGIESGAIITCGPTGSGKSTLLHAALEELKSRERNILTLEDPVERLLQGVSQIELGGRSAAGLLPALLRQDPDVLCLGEIRDSATANMALGAAQTGHLLLSTLHSANCLEAILRLMQLGVSQLIMVASVKLIISQRLIPRACKHCARSAELPANAASLLKLNTNQSYVECIGCEKCGGRGAHGRVGVFEFLPLSERVREVLLRPNTGDILSYLKLAAEETGYEAFGLRVRELLVAGEISISSALRVLGLSGLLR